MLVLYEKEPLNKIGIIERCFLRSLAIERSKSHMSKLAPYRNALVKVIVITIGLPTMAIFSFVGIGTMRWWDPIVSQRWPWLSVRMIGLVLCIMVFTVGHRTVGSRFRKYKNNYSACDIFDTERDRKIVFWQFFISVFICSFVFPLLGVVVNRVF